MDTAINNLKNKLFDLRGKMDGLEDAWKMQNPDDECPKLLQQIKDITESMYLGHDNNCDIVCQIADDLQERIKELNHEVDMASDDSGQIESLENELEDAKGKIQRLKNILSNIADVASNEDE